jgi:hypothetical protein
MVLFYLFHKKFSQSENFLWKRSGFFRPASGGISCRVNDRVIPVN